MAPDDGKEWESKLIPRETFYRKFEKLMHKDVDLKAN